MPPLALSLILAACAYTTVSSPGKSDDAIRADMNSCDAGSLTLHSRAVIDCLSNHGDTITYDDGHIPPYTNANPYNVSLTAAEVQQRKDAANVVLKRWQEAAQMPTAPPAVQSNVRSENNPISTTPTTTVAQTAAAPESDPEPGPKVVDAFSDFKPDLTLRCGNNLVFIDTSEKSVHLGDDPNQGWWSNRKFQFQEDANVHRGQKWTLCSYDSTQYVRIGSDKIEFGATIKAVNSCGAKYPLADSRGQVLGGDSWEPNQIVERDTYVIDRRTGLFYPGNIQCAKLTRNPI